MDMTVSKKEKNEIVMMDFSGIYEEEKFWKEEKVSWVNARDISGTNCYCDEEARMALRERIADFPAGGIHFIDSGNYHYMSLLWLEKIDRPFRLLVFDNHTDMQPPAFGGLLSCGGWIASALEELENLKEVILVGPDEEAYGQVEEEFRKKVRFLSRENLEDCRTQEGDILSLVKNFFREMDMELPLYLSVDKDVLSPMSAHTTWSQGDMSLEELKECLKMILSYYKENCGELIGMDVCGECDSKGDGSSERNDRANEELLEVTGKGAAFEK